MKKKEQSKKEKTNKTALLSGLKDGYPKGYLRNRFLAAVLDLFVVTFLCQYALMLFGHPNWPKYLEMQEAVMGLAADHPLVVERMALFQHCFIITLCIGMVYEAVMLVCFKASLGKLIFHLRVVALHSSRNIWLNRLMLVLRTVIKAFSIYLLSAIPFIFLSLSVLGNRIGQSGFDLFVKTKVIDNRSVESKS